MRNLSTIMQYRPSEEKIVRLINGGFYMQHDVDIINDNTISIYDNNRITNIQETKVRDYNWIKLYNFENNEFRKKFENQMINLNVKTLGQGLLEFIDNETVLVEEHEQNRILIFQDDRVILEYYNTAKDNKRYNLYWSRYIKDPKLIKLINELIDKKIC